MASKQDFRDRFGLDYLVEKTGNIQQQRSPEKLPPGLEDALLAYGGKVMAALKGAPGQTMKFFDLAKQLSVRVDTLSPVIQYLVGKGYLERTQEDPLGDDTLRLSEAGRKVPA
jgi:hypothetical protein